MVEVSLKSNLAVSSVMNGGEKAVARAATEMPHDIAQVKEVAHQTATQVFNTKTQVGDELERLQQQMEAPVQQLNEMLKGSGRALSIGIDRAVNGPVVTVRNADTGEVVRQIPNEVVIRMAHSIEAFKGWLHDQKV